MKTKSQLSVVALFLTLMLFATGSSLSAQTFVHVCKNPKAKVYHKKLQCSALKNCKAGTTNMKVGQAKAKKLKQCKICYGTARSTSSNYVHICKSKGAKVYHKKPSCSKLKACKAGKTKIKLGQAKSRKLKACSFCYKKS